MLKNRLATLCKEPLIQFVILGAVIFALYSWLVPDKVDATEDILVTVGQVQQLQARFERIRGRQPNKTETEGLIDGFIRETVYYREALALGLDQDDPIIRNRLRQKFIFLQDGLNALEVTDSELKDFYQQNKQKYALPGTYSFTQIYLGNKLLSETQEIAKRIKRALSKGANPSSLGEVTLLPGAMQNASPQQITNRFGEAFTTSLATLPVNDWSNPVTSAFGAHLVFIKGKTPASEPDFEAIKPQLQRDLMYVKRKDQQEMAYQVLQNNYRITIHWPSKESTENGVLN